MSLPGTRASRAAENALPLFDVAILLDGGSDAGQPFEEIFRSELLGLTEGELELRFTTFAGDYDRPSILSAIEQAYTDPEIELVLAIGFAANQLLASRETFPKPTFLPIVFDARLAGLPPPADRGSGVPNLAYLADNSDFASNLDNFLDVVRFERLALLVDSIVLSAAGNIAEQSAAIAAQRGIEVVLVPFDDPRGDLLALIPEQVDAVMTGGLFRLDETALELLVAGLIERRLPSFSFEGDQLVRRGLMTTDSPASDWQRLARRIALAMQAVMLGERAEDQPVSFEAKRRLFINMETARAIDVFPRFDVLVEATLVGDDPAFGGPKLTLAEAALEAAEANLALLAERYGTEAGAEAIAEARSNLLPQLVLGSSISRLDDGSLAVASGMAAERSVDASLTVTQLLWSEPAWAGVAIERRLQQSREAELAAFRLDTVQLATVAFLDVLRAETQVRIQRDNLELTRLNLELARDRVRVGTTSVSDIYRWESQLATARQAAVDAFAARLRARENLNRILHRPLDAPFDPVPTTLDDPALLFNRGELDNLVNDPKTYRRLIGLLVEQGIDRAPELEVFDALIAAQERQLASIRRERFSPQVVLQGQASEVLEEERVGGDLLEGELDWSLGLSASLSLTTGGERRARRARAELELIELRTRRAATREQIEQGVRANVHRANASFMKISLAREAESAARKSLELVTDAYSQGAVSILDLLDAQNASLQASEGASNAVFGFLIDLMNVQRSIGRFDFFIPQDRRPAEIERVLDYLTTEAPTLEGYDP